MNRERSFTFAWLILLTIIVSLVYSNTLNSPFVFDDIGFITDDPAIRMTELSWAGLEKAALEGKPPKRLIPNISFALNYYFSHYDVIGYHLFNIAIHLATGFLLFFLIFLLLQRYGHLSGVKYPVPPTLIAFFSALIWLVQPVNTQAVTYIVQRMTSLGAFFYILSFLLYVWARGHWHAHGKLNSSNAFGLLGCILAGICAVISKQNTAMLPVILLLYEWYFFHDLSISFSKKQVIGVGGVLMIFGAIAFLYLGKNPWDRILYSYTWRDFTLPERVMTEWRVILYYISLLFYPNPGRLVLDHDYPLSTSMSQPSSTWLAFTALTCLAGLTIYLARKNRLLSFCLVWFLTNLVIESSVIGIEIIYDHRTYLPFMLLILAIIYLAFYHIRSKKVVISGICAFALVFSIWAHQRNTIWASRIAFWEDGVQKAPHDFRPHNDLGVAYYDAGLVDAAISHYEKAMTLEPDHPDTLNNLGNAMKFKGHIKRAMACYSRAIHINPRYSAARINLAAALIQQQKYREALRHLNQVLSNDPENAEAHVNAGTAMVGLGRVEAAIGHFRKAIAIHPDIAEVHNNLGVLLIHKGDFRAARSHFQSALRLKPDYGSANDNLRKLSVLIEKNGQKG